jgi:hypothetical protein
VLVLAMIALVTGLLRSGGSSGCRRLSTITALNDRSRMLHSLAEYISVSVNVLALRIISAFLLIIWHRGRLHLATYDVSPMDSLLALLQLFS